MVGYSQSMLEEFYILMSPIVDVPRTPQMACRHRVQQGILSQAITSSMGVFCLAITSSECSFFHGSFFLDGSGWGWEAANAFI